MSFLPDRSRLIPHILFRAKIDAINFLAPSAPYLPKRHFDHAHGPKGFSLPDPTRDELERLKEFPVVRIEVAVDAFPKLRLRQRIVDDEDLRAMFMRQTYLLLTESLYPWNALGIAKHAVRSFGIPEGPKPRNFSRPEFGETLYFGHRDDPSSAKVYFKTKDQDIELPPEKHCVRVEVTLEQPGCVMHGLRDVGDVVVYGFRTRLRPFFHCIRPMVKVPDFRRDDKLFRLMHDRLLKYREQLVGDAVSKAGVHALLDHPSAVTNQKAAYAQLNRALRRSLHRTV